MAAGFGDRRCTTRGCPVGPDRCERLARAVTIMGATTVAELRACALATMVSDPGQMPTFDRVFAAVFGGPSPFRHLNLPTAARSSSAPNPTAAPSPRAGPRTARATCRPACASRRRPGRGGQRRAAGRGPGRAPGRVGRRAAQRPRLHRAVPGRTPPAGHAHARDGAGHPAAPDPQVPQPPATASGPTCAGRCGWPGAPAARRSGSPAGRRGSSRAGWWCCATSPARWSPTPAPCSCCSTC